MPRVRKVDVPFARVQRILRGYGLNGPALASILGCTPNTARARLEKPETFTLDELWRISQSGHIHFDEIRESIVR